MACNHLEYTLNSLFGWFSEETIIDIDYVARETLDEEEKLTLIDIKLDIASKAGFTVKKDWLAKELKIPLEDKEIDPLGINPDAKNDDELASDIVDESDEEEEKNKKLLAMLINYMIKI